MSLQALTELLDGTAFRPDSINRTVRLLDRFPGGRLLAVSIGREHAKVGLVTIGRKGAVTVSNVTTQTKEREGQTLANFLGEQAKRYRVKDLLVLYGRDWNVEFVETTFRGPDQERNRLLIEDPAQVLPGHLNSSTIYAMVANPTLNKSVLFTSRRPSCDEVFKDVAGASLNVARMQPGIYALLRYAVEECAERIKGRDLLLVDESGALLLNEEMGDWSDMGFKRDLLHADGASLAEVNGLLARGRVDPNKPLAYISTVDLNAGANLPSDSLNLLPDTRCPDFVAACTEGAQRLATDFNPANAPHRDHLPAARRPIATFGLAVLLIVYGAAAHFFISERANRARIADAQTEKVRAIEERKSHEGHIRESRENRARAEQQARWLQVGVTVQPIIVATLEATKGKVLMEDLRIVLTEGTPQMDLGFTVKGDERKVGAFIEEVLARLSEAGFGLVNPEQRPAPGGNGVLFLGKFLAPAPYQVKWQKEVSE